MRTLELRKDNHPIPLAPKPSRALAKLLAAPGEIVLRTELIEELWDKRPEEVDRSLNFAIRQVRNVLHDDANRPVFLETIPRRGYRFIAPVATVSRNGDVAPQDTSNTVQRTRNLSGRVRLTIAATMVGILFVTMRFFVPTTSTPRLAILPMEQLGTTPEQDYFASGLRHELVAELARLPADKVTLIARYSTARMADATLEEITQTIDADYVLRGSVTSSGQTMRMVFELVASPQGTVVWAERFEGALPTSTDLEYVVAARVADALAIELLDDTANPFTTRPSPLARELYLKGTHLLREGSRERIPDAVRLLDSALQESPDYPAAHVALGRAMLRRGNRNGRQHIERAVTLDPLVAGAYEALGDDDLYHNWDTVSAARYFDLAIASRPGEAEPYHRRAYFLSLLGKHDQAIASITRALALDPVSPMVTGDVGRIYYRAGRFQQAEEYCAKSLDLLGNESVARSCLLNLRLLAGDISGGMEQALALLQLYRANENFLTYVRGAAPQDAMDAYWEWWIRAWSPQVQSDPDALIPIAQAHVWLGNLDQALDALDEAMRRGSATLPLVAGDPCFAPLFHNPRYQQIFKQSGLPLSPPPNIS